MWNAGLDEAQAGIKIAGRNINNLRYADDTTLMAENEELEPLDESARGEWKSWLKTQHLENYDHGIQSHHFMENRWRNRCFQPQWKHGLSLFWGGSKITVDGDFSHEIKDAYSLEGKLWPT